ncbi:UDP-forming cellulose synthase catalytic subunit [Xylophilus ampelinus]|nr:UDP-forming cellulose synthase catalytic subunit [Xylophilus ampelinus]
MASAGWGPAFCRAVLIGALAVVFAVVVTTPLDNRQQIAFAAVCFAAVLILRRYTGGWATLAMVALSIIASARYLWWRITDTLGFETWLDAFFGTGLVVAEIYALIVLLLGYFQTSWPLVRKPAALPADLRLWPTVDLFIPTYNESLDVVRQTVFAARGMDWPAEKLQIWVLDDGRRAAFKEFCAEAGVGYFDRDDNLHAKAGNINAALARTKGELVAIFDCDHIPTRSFLQVTTGWFLKDAKLAMVQTPHVFFSPDPFEKNLSTFRRTPNEAELFYGLIQEGNDLWNAAFFCGSCAVLRRTALMQVGGIAVETVTEDAHTALKLNRQGFNTAYLAVPQAAGLATESLSGHIGQRIRWARGMAQIARTDNPLLGPGLRLGQRLCYLNAMLHFFYGLPRIIFMTAPLAYLLFGAHIFQATAVLILSYALPHLLNATVTNSRIQGQYRHSFWNEVYESVLAWYILRPVLAAFVNPRLGKFNVTSKGGLVPEPYFDWGIATPYIVLMALNLLGVVVGLFRLHDADSLVTGTILINVAWTIYNLFIASASVAVASESRQVRHGPRVPARIPASLKLSDGHALQCETKDFSQFGIGLEVDANVPVALGDRMHLGLFREQEESVFPATVVFRSGSQLGLAFDTLNTAQNVELTRLTFGRADAWTRTWTHGRRDRPLTSMVEVLGTGARGFALLFTHGLQRAGKTVTASPATPPAEMGTP